MSHDISLQIANATEETFQDCLDQVESIVEIAGCSSLMLYSKKNQLVERLLFFLVVGRKEAAVNQ